MINLVPAKCPSCGAKLELDDNLKKAECEYCQNTIVVDDAIAKYKLEISGKVKVSDVKDYSDKLLIVKKHIKAGKYDRAKATLESILEDDEYNLEALKEYLSLLLEHEVIFLEECSTKESYLALISDKRNMLESSDDDGNYKEFIEKVRKKEESIQKEIKDIEHDMLIVELYGRCNEYINIDESNEKRTKELEQYFKVENISVESLKNAVKENEDHEIKYVENIIENYYKKKDKRNKEEEQLHLSITVIISAIMLICEWTYIIKDIIHSFSNFSIIVPLAALIFIALGVGVSFLIVLLANIISNQIAKIIMKQFIK